MMHDSPYVAYSIAADDGASPARLVGLVNIDLPPDAEWATAVWWKAQQSRDQIREQIAQLYIALAAKGPAKGMPPMTAEQMGPLLARLLEGGEPDENTG